MKPGWVVVGVALVLAAAALDWLMVLPRWGSVTLVLGVAAAGLIQGLRSRRR